MPAAPQPAARPRAQVEGEGLRGVLAMIAACVIWGLSGIYYNALNHLPPPEILSHRTIWSLVFFIALLAARGRLPEFAALLRDRRALPTVALAALVISLNWGLFIFAVGTGRGLQASLGYYIFPLVAVLLGVALLGERLTRAQIISVVLAAAAVMVLAMGVGAMPWMALMLATTFGIYGVTKRRLTHGPVVSVAGEVALLAPFALIWLAGVHLAGWQGMPAELVGGGFGHDWPTTIMLILSGPLTALPLVLFSYAAKRITYAAQGLIQYLNPTLQFTVAVVVFGEPFTHAHAVAFPLIWGALALYSLASWRAAHPH